MGLSATYDGVLSRVRLSAVLNAAATTTALFERSVDQITWTTVRGGSAVPVTAGAAALDDYEFSPDVVNVYRVTATENAVSSMRTAAGAPAVTSGAAMVWATTKNVVASPGWTITTGRGLVTIVRQGNYLTRATTTITPTLGGVWLKAIGKPFLNRQVVIQDFSAIERPARTGVFDIIGRSFPVAVTDVRGSRRWTLTVLASSLAEATTIDTILASGEPLLVHVPADCDVPGGYVTVGDTSEARTARVTNRRLFTLPCTEVAAPAADIVGTTVTWQTVLNTYGSWQAVMAAHATWADLLELIGSPTDVIVP